MNKEHITVVAGVFDGLSARIAEDLGFECIGIGGYAVGASLAVTEPLLSLSEFINQTRYIVNAVQVPAIADIGAGWGEAIHTTRTVREFESTGVAAVQIEDQVYPKRMGYHLGETYVISQNEMIKKLRAAIKAREDDELVIIARTDAIKAVGGGFEEGFRRIKAFEAAGADMILAYPDTMEQLEKICRSIKIPFFFDATFTTKAPIYGGIGRPPTPEELDKVGVKLTDYSDLANLISVEAIWNILREVKDGRLVIDPTRISNIREKLEDLIGIKRYYGLEKQ